MIGKALTKSQMVALLKNMGTIDQPWVSDACRGVVNEL